MAEGRGSIALALVGSAIFLLLGWVGYGLWQSATSIPMEIGWPAQDGCRMVSPVHSKAGEESALIWVPEGDRELVFKCGDREMVVTKRISMYDRAGNEQYSIEVDPLKEGRERSKH